MANLAKRHCTPIKKGTKPIRSSAASGLLQSLQKGWELNQDASFIEREFHFNSYHETIAFVNAVAWIAHAQDHHPDISIAYNNCKVSFTTHAAGGLTVNDFICAAKIDSLNKGKPLEKADSKPQKPKQSEQETAEPKAEQSPNTAPPSTDANPNSNTDPQDKQAADNSSPAVETETTDKLDKDKLDTAASTSSAQAQQETEDAQETKDDIEQEAELSVPFDPSEAAALLDAEDEDPTQNIQTEVSVDDEPEILLFDPDEETTQQTAYEATEQTAAVNDDANRDNNNLARQVSPADDHDEAATLILPPGMQVIEDNMPSPNSDPDEEATIITPQDEAIPVHLQHDPDEVSTMIMDHNVPDFTEDPDEVKTMVINEPDASEGKTEEHLSTMLLSNEERQQIMSEQQATQSNDQNNAQSETDPAIEADDTIVMHVNDYSQVKQN